MVPFQAAHAPLSTLPFTGVSVSVMVSVTGITDCVSLQPVTWASAVPLYPAPDGYSVMGNGVYWYASLGGEAATVTFIVQSPEVQDGIAFHVSVQW